jgi:hypothetical protein
VGASSGRPLSPGELIADVLMQGTIHPPSEQLRQQLDDCEHIAFSHLMRDIAVFNLPARVGQLFGNGLLALSPRAPSGDGHLVDRRRVGSPGLAIRSARAEAERGAASRVSPHRRRSFPTRSAAAKRPAPAIDRDDSSPPSPASAAPEPPFEVEHLRGRPQPGSKQGFRREQRDVMAGRAINLLQIARPKVLDPRGVEGMLASPDVH